MSVLSEQVYRRRHDDVAKHRRHKSRKHRRHLVVDFFEWTAIAMFVAYLVTNQESAREMFLKVVEMFGQ